MAMPAPDAASGSNYVGGRAVPRRTRAGHGQGRRRLSAAEERRSDLLEAAVIEFAENGYHGTRTADIAARAGVSQPYVYALFPDKRLHDAPREVVRHVGRVMLGNVAVVLDLPPEFRPAV